MEEIMLEENINRMLDKIDEHCKTENGRCTVCKIAWYCTKETLNYLDIKKAYEEVRHENRKI